VEKVDHSGEDAAVVNPKEVALRMRLDYSRGVKDHSTRALEAICELCWKLEQPNVTADSFVRDAAGLISKIFGIESVAIGVWDPVDRLYKYKAVVGLEKEGADRYSNLAYTREQLLNGSTYPSHEISSHTRLYLSEEHPYTKGEEYTYRRPGLIGMKRRTLTDSLEADYLDIFFHEPHGSILGFIEISGTRLRKLPDVATIRWIELIGALLSVAVQKEA
jgi:hypothetical protein